MKETGLSTTYVRTENRKRVTSLLYQNGAMSKRELSRASGLSLPTINLLALQLREDGLVFTQAASESSGGRIPEIIHFQYDGRYAFGAEITGHHIRLCLINLGGTPLVRKTLSIAFRNERAYWLELRAILLELLQQNNIKEEQILGIGISIPGVVRQEEQFLDFAPTLGLRHFDYRNVASFLGFPVIFENDANAGGFSEAWTLGDNLSDAIYISVSKGVGGAVIVDHQLSYGRNRRCGEFGHMTIMPHGIQCSCGKSGCFEAYCSTKVLTADCDDQLSIFFQRLPERADYQARWETYLSNLALAVSNICIAWDAPVVIGGAISSYLENDFQRFVQTVEQLIPFSSNNAYLSLSKFGANAASTGAALMIVAQHLNLFD